MAAPLPHAAARLRIAALAATAMLSALCCGRSEPPPRAAISVAGVLSGDTSGFARAETPRDFTFPRDHGPHPRFRTGWWYFTGNLDGPGGERFGYQLTVFRNALAPPADHEGTTGTALTGQANRSTERASRWTTRQAWLAHFAVTDGAGRRFFADQRLARGGRIDLAGGSISPAGLRLRVDDWSVLPATPDAPSNTEDGAARGLLPARLEATQEGAAIDLTVHPGKPIVLQGDRGLSVKGRDPVTGAVNASYYYSFTRLPTTGTVSVGDRTFAVSGTSWMDREWSTSALSGDQVGWDWFALQLDDGRDLMVYALRRAAAAGGGIDPASSGTLVAADGTSRHLVRSDVSIEVLDHWTSPSSGVAYPSRWRLRVPRAGLDLEIRPVLADQELDVGFRYWEGAVDVRRTGGGSPPVGRGYVELTGYGPDAVPGQGETAGGTSTRPDDSEEMR